MCVCACVCVCVCVSVIYLLHEMRKKNIHNALNFFVCLLVFIRKFSFMFQSETTRQTVQCEVDLSSCLKEMRTSCCLPLVSSPRKSVCEDLPTGVVYRSYAVLQVCLVIIIICMKVSRRIKTIHKKTLTLPYLVNQISRMQMKREMWAK